MKLHNTKRETLSNSVIIMKMFLLKMFICLKISNIECNLGRSASYLISVDAKYCNIAINCCSN